MPLYLRYLVLMATILVCGFDRVQAVPLMEGIKLPVKLAFCGEQVPLDNSDVRERFEKEMLLTLWDRPQVLLWIKRAPRYLNFIAQQLHANHMPDDLKYLAIAESALRPHAGSAKGAVGFWQMLPETARKYGLTVNADIDERRNLQASTQAALRYLQELHDKFSSWTLAAAAYNMGEEGLTAEVLEQNTKDYYRLYLPLETQRFIFRILAAKLIVQDPQAYGFQLARKDLYKPLLFDTVALDCFQEVPIRLVAEAAGTYFKRIKDLNPQLRGHYIQEGHYQIHLPPGSAKGFQERLDRLLQTYSQLRQQRIYVVKSGDSLSSIAAKFNVPLAAIIIWNRVDLDSPLYPGDRLVIYPQPVQEHQP